jgi:hypothetical protein
MFSYFTEEELAEIKANCEFNSNNCGGCETCAQVFSGPPELYDYEETYRLILTIEQLRKELREK